PSCAHKLMSTLTSSSRTQLILSFSSFHDTPPTELYTLSLHDALPISHGADEVIDYSREDLKERLRQLTADKGADVVFDPVGGRLDRKSTRLNSSHVKISYAVFCLKKKSCPTAT